MATKAHYEFFRSLYDEEERTYEQLEGRGKVYLTILAAFLAALLFKAEEVSDSARVLGVPGLLVLFEGVLLAASLLFVLFALRIQAYEAVTDPEELIESWEGELPTDEEFFLDRIADYAVASSRNLEANA